jgi:hypothetical protein
VGIITLVAFASFGVASLNILRDMIVVASENIMLKTVSQQ